MSVRDLVDAIASGDSVATQQAFETEMMARIADRIDAQRQDVAASMFNAEQVEESADEEEEDLTEATMCHADAIHVSPAGKNAKGMPHYKVHAVGDNMKDHIKVGEHLTDTELDDFADAGGKVKQIKGSATK